MRVFISTVNRGNPSSSIERNKEKSPYGIDQNMQIEAMDFAFYFLLLNWNGSVTLTSIF